MLAACGAAIDDSAGLSRMSARGDAALGQRLIAQHQCGSCHAIPDVPAARGVYDPSLQTFGKPSYTAGHIPNRPDALAQWLVAPALNLLQPSNRRLQWEEV